MPIGKYIHKRLSLHDRFWRYVRADPSGCWLWTGLTINGYGVLGAVGSGRKTVRAHRISYELMVGLIPEDMSVCHSCDIRACVYPGHLWLGTQRENIRDAIKKGRLATGKQHGSHTHPERTARGKKHYQAKLTESSVRSIRATPPSTYAEIEEIAKHHGVSVGTIYHVLKRDTWAWLS